MAKIIFEEIHLYPTEFIVDVIITKSEIEAISFVTDRYDELVGDSQFVGEENILNTVRIIDLPSYKKYSDTRILLILEDLKDRSTIAHELIHVLWALSDLSGIEINKESQEWQAQMMSYLFDEVLGIPEKN